jgi:hypothetical protein
VLVVVLLAESNCKSHNSGGQRGMLAAVFTPRSVHTLDTYFIHSIVIALSKFALALLYLYQSPKMSGGTNMDVMCFKLYICVC